MVTISKAGVALSVAAIAMPLYAQVPEAAPPPLLDAPPVESRPTQPPPQASPAPPSQSVSSPPPSSTPPPPPDVPAPPPADVPAPRPRLVHDGFYLAVSSGFAQVWASGDGPNGSASLSGLGSSVGLAIGGTPVRGLAIAGVFRGVSRTGTFDGGPTITATTSSVSNGVAVTSTSTLSGRAQASSFMLGVQADWFIRPEDGWHVGAGVGLGGLTITDDAGGTKSATSVSGTLFGGYQWWIGPRWSMGLQAVVLAAPRMKLSDSGGSDTGYRMTPISFGIEANILYY